MLSEVSHKKIINVHNNKSFLLNVEYNDKQYAFIKIMNSTKCMRYNTPI